MSTATASSPSRTARRRSSSIGASSIRYQRRPGWRAVEMYLDRRGLDDLPIKDQGYQQRPVDDMPRPTIDARHLRDEKQAVREIERHRRGKYRSDERQFEDPVNPECE